MTPKEDKESKKIKDMVRDLELRVQALEYNEKELHYAPVVIHEETYTSNYPYCT